MAWQLQEAKQHFSEVVRKAEEEGPQHVTRHGQEVAVVLSVDAYRRLTGDTEDLRDFLLAPGPDLSQLDLDRVRDYPKDIAL